MPYEASILGRPSEVAELDAEGNLLLMDGVRFRLRLLDPLAVDFSTVRLECVEALRFVKETGQFLKGWYFRRWLVDTYLNALKPLPESAAPDEVPTQADRLTWRAVAPELDKPEVARRADEVAGVAWFRRWPAPAEGDTGEPDGPYLLSEFTPNGNENVGVGTPPTGNYTARIAGKRGQVCWDPKQADDVILVEGVPHRIQAEGINPQVLREMRLLRICKLRITSTPYKIRERWFKHSWTLDGRSWIRWRLRLNRFMGNEFYRRRLDNTLDHLKDTIEERLEQDEPFRDRVAWVAFAAGRLCPAGDGGTCYEPIFLTAFAQLPEIPETVAAAAEERILTAGRRAARALDQRLDRLQKYWGDTPAVQRARATVLRKGVPEPFMEWTVEQQYLTGHWPTGAEALAKATDRGWRGKRRGRSLKSVLRWIRIIRAERREAGLDTGEGEDAMRQKTPEFDVAQAKDTGPLPGEMDEPPEAFVEWVENQDAAGAIPTENEVLAYVRAHADSFSLNSCSSDDLRKIAAKWLKTALEALDSPQTGPLYPDKVSDLPAGAGERPN